MKAQDLAFLGARLLALYCLINFISYPALGQFLLMAFIQTESEFFSLMVYGLLPFTLYGLCTVGLWFGADALSRRIAPSTNSRVQTSISATELQTIAFAAVGLFITITALTQLAGQLLQIQRAITNSNGNIDTMQWVSLLPLLIQALVGAALFVGARGFSGLIMRLRHAGLDAKN